MSATASNSRVSGLLPSSGRGAGQPLWGEPPRRQPIVPLIVLAMVTLLVAAPAALSGSGTSSNPIALMHSIADTTYTLTGLLDRSNKTLTAIDGNSQPLGELTASMAGIAASAKGMEQKTTQLDAKLGTVGAAVATSQQRLVGVDTKLTTSAEGIDALGGKVDGSLTSTKAIVKEFGAINGSIGSMDSTLKTTIGLMVATTPLTRSFAENQTRQSVAGGDGHKFGIPNIVPGNRVMSVVLPMIDTMQNGGTLAARKESATATNPLIGIILKRQVPDGTNVGAIVQPYDGQYGLPAREWFVANRVLGF